MVPTVKSVFDWEYLLEYLVETLITPVLRGGVELEEVLERLQLHLEQVRVLKENF